MLVQSFCLRLGLLTLAALSLAAAARSQTVSRTPGEKQFITDIVGIDGFFDDLLNPPGIPQFDQNNPLLGQFLNPDDPQRPRFDNGTQVLDEEDPNDFLPAESEFDGNEGGLLGNGGDDLGDFSFAIEESDELEERFETVDQERVYLANLFREATFDPMARDLERLNNRDLDPEQEASLNIAREQYNIINRAFDRAVANNAPPDELRRLATVAQGVETRIRGLILGSQPGSTTASQKNIVFSQSDVGAAPSIWGTIHYTGTQNTSAAARESTRVGIASGVVFQPRPDLTWGIGVSVTDGENTSAPPLNTILESTTLGLSAFVTYNWPQDVDLSFIGSYRSGEHDISINGFTGSYSTDALSASAKVSKAFLLQDGWRIKPSLGVTFASINRETYVNSAGRTINGGTQTFGLLKPALRAEKLFVSNGTAYVPWIEANADWLFDKPAGATLSDGLVLGSSETGFGLSGGVAIASSPSTRFNLSGSYRVRGDDTAWSINLGFRTEF